MKDEKGSVRTIYLRPLVVAAAFTFPVKAMVFILWGLIWYPDRNASGKFLWSAIDATAMAVAAGLMVGFIVGRRYQGLVAGVMSSLCYATVMVASILICFELDLEIGLFGFRSHMQEYIATILLPAMLTAPLYGWLLHSSRGKAVLSRIGL